MLLGPDLMLPWDGRKLWFMGGWFSRNYVRWKWLIFLFFYFVFYSLLLLSLLELEMPHSYHILLSQYQSCAFLMSLFFLAFFRLLKITLNNFPYPPIWGTKCSLSYFQKPQRYQIFSTYGKIVNFDHASC